MVVVVAGLFGIVGCDSDSPAKPTDPVLEPGLIVGDGVVKGRVLFGGTPREPKVLKNEPCHDGAELIYDETIVVNDDGSLRNVLVWVEGLPRISGADRPAAVLDQRNCQYVPHVLGVQIMQPLTIRSSDPTLHNVHYTPDENRAGNHGFTGVGGDKTLTFDHAEVVRMKCDVHPWMSAYVGVFNNGYFAVTREDGRFEITGLPAGTYELVAWHEQFGQQKQQITVGDGSPAEVMFEYKAP